MLTPVAISLICLSVLGCSGSSGRRNSVVAAANGTVITEIAGAAFADISETDDDPPTLRNTRIFFTNNKTGNYQIYSMNADGTDVRQLTSGSTCEYPALSPNGTKIAFSSERNGHGYRIYTMNTDGSGVTLLPVGPSAANKPHFNPTWSLDGTKIIYGYLYSDRDMDIYGYDLTTNTDFVVDDSTNNDMQPAWSPDWNQDRFFLRPRWQLRYLYGTCNGR